jgi:hypothetical protein
MSVARFRTSPGPAFVFASLLVAFTLAPRASADPPPLPPAMQAEVNRAIDRGVWFLRQTQGPWGTWTSKKDHPVAYAALPGLTLLECGAGKNDPAVLRAAQLVRAAAPGLDRTYDLSLAILFLDRLGNPKDKKLIQTFALRLVAGQTATGGWSYKCPIPPKEAQQELLVVLKKLRPEVPFDPITAVANGGADLPMAIGGDPSALPGGIAPGGPGLPGGIAPGKTGLPTAVGPGDRTDPASLGSQHQPGGLVSGGTAPPSPDPAATSARPLRRGPGGALCIKMLDNPGPSGSAPARVGAAGKPRTPPKKVNIPRRLRGLPVLWDPNRLALIDPPKRDQEPLWGTTDNSNSQFGVLGLWAARRHGVPLDRSFFLMVRRYSTSQNADGGWGYRYRRGGGEGGSPAMTCVGLLGLAVGHGLARDARAQGDPEAARKLAQDRQVLGGLVALGRHVGVPSGRWNNLPMQNLYFLWSVERVAVLYNLPTIGAKEWYRWGAEILLANQQPNGNWDKGGYHGADPTIDTCLALLFLKRANLTDDLTGRLPFRPDDLTRDITDKLLLEAPKQPPAPAPEVAPAPVLPTPPAAPGPPPADPGLQGIQKDKTGTPPSAPPAPPPAPTAPSESERGREEGGMPVLLWVFVLLGLLLLLGGGALLVVLRKESEAKPAKAPRPHRANKGSRSGVKRKR